MLSKQFKQRILVSFLGTIALILSITFSFMPFFKPIFIILSGGIISLALLEYYRLSQRKGFQPLISLGVVATIVYLITVAFSFFQRDQEAIPFLVLLLSLLVFFLMFFNQQTNSIGNLAVTVFGIVYLTIPLSCALKINYFFPSLNLQDGRLWLAYVLIVSKMTDVGAYFSGKSFGKRMLAPVISPKKTIEGAIGGVLIALIASMFFHLLISNQKGFNISFVQSIWIGLCISLLAQLGDLSESLLKRDAGVKDSSHLPGLGGILDVVDSLVFTLPFMYLLLQMHVVG